MTRINLFCFPFAGGDFFSYRPFTQIAPASLRLMPVELPGRGKRINQPLMSDIHALAEEGFRSLEPHLHEPYAIYGHSMGALLGYLVTRIIIERKKPPPVYLCLTGARGPSVKRREPLRHKMNDEELINELRMLGGVSEEVLQSEQLMDFYSAILRKDFEAIENYQHQLQEPLGIPITIITGMKEKITREDVDAWDLETTYQVKKFQFPGDHFFVFEYPAEVLKRIHIDINEILHKPTPSFKI